MKEDDKNEPVIRAHVRLYESDIEELERRAKQTGATWVGYLRELVHRALKSKGEIR